jgi:AraC family transcriptional regulator, transcriptional activator of pobA
MRNEQIPVYSLQSFSSPERKSQQFQVEVFDANRHFQVKYPHRHDFFEVLFLSHGSGFHVIDGNKYPITPPCVFFMSPGQAHKLEFSNDIEGYIFIFTPEFYLINKANPNALIEFPFFFTIHQDNPPLFLSDFQDIFFIENIFIRCLAELKREEGCSIDLLRSLLDVILHQCAALYSGEGNSSTKGKGHILVKRFYQLVEKWQIISIQSHYASSWSSWENAISWIESEFANGVDYLKGKKIVVLGLWCSRFGTRLKPARQRFRCFLCTS